MAHEAPAERANVELSAAQLCAMNQHKASHSACPWSHHEGADAARFNSPDAAKADCGRRAARGADGRALDGGYHGGTAAMEAKMIKERLQKHGFNTVTGDGGPEPQGPAVEGPTSFATDSQMAYQDATSPATEAKMIKERLQKHGFNTVTGDGGPEAHLVQPAQPAQPQGPAVEGPTSFATSFARDSQMAYQDATRCAAQYRERNQGANIFR